jgi:RNA polymerase sigma-70 factor (ECF subfamily)
MPWTPEEVHHGLQTLSAHHRDALTLFFLQDLSIDEMADVLGVSPGTVKSRLFYGKKALRESLESMRNRT